MALRIARSCDERITIEFADERERNGRSAALQRNGIHRREGARQLKAGGHRAGASRHAGTGGGRFHKPTSADSERHLQRTLSEPQFRRGLARKMGLQVGRGQQANHHGGASHETGASGHHRQKTPVSKTPFEVTVLVSKSKQPSGRGV